MRTIKLNGQLQAIESELSRNDSTKRNSTESNQTEDAKSKPRSCDSILCLENRTFFSRCFSAKIGHSRLLVSLWVSDPRITASSPFNLSTKYTFDVRPDQPDEIRRLKENFDELVTSWHLDPDEPYDIHQSKINYTDVENHQIDRNHLCRVVQIHRCSRSYCLRKKIEWADL